MTETNPSDYLRILVAVDPDVERARTQARYVASLSDGAAEIEALLLYVFGDVVTPFPDKGAGLRPPARRTSSLRPTVRQVRSVMRVKEYLEDRDITVRLLGDSGTPPERILAQADALNTDCIVLGSRKRGPVRTALFGSTSTAVLRNTDCPVVVTGQRPTSMLGELADRLHTTLGERLPALRRHERPPTR